ncbi:hypothetical protein EVAR_25969_1 [Eumeta japonica]|uniref:Uncharacterized protein n=1 Tax=Eumeta variegata TaxID=151549 RepID=A0A4C1V270_EUMVA|nr:hypothetical protein EVAR_25969_1 [Eumeta japonica]
MTKKKIKTIPAYFGHPMRFWNERHQDALKTSVDVEELKRLRDVVDYDAVHLQLAIINRTETKVMEKLRIEENLLESRREKLRVLLAQEEEKYIREIKTRQEMKECKVCVNREKKVQEYFENIQKEQVMACQKALEREKIARGIESTKQDEIDLRQMQKMQMQEKELIALKEKELDRMWHQVLLDGVRKKEEIEDLERDKRNREMLQRRKTYDEQISSANKKKNKLIQEEREKENKRIQYIKTRMEEQYAEVVRRKKEQQTNNKRNYEEQSLDKYLRRQEEKNKERHLENIIICDAQAKLKEEKIKRFQNMLNQQKEKLTFIEQNQCERLKSFALIEETEQMNEELKKEMNFKADEKLKTIEFFKKKMKQERANEYTNYIENKQKYLEELKEKKKESMHRVKQTAINEVKRNLANAQDELRRQLQYRNGLDTQLFENRRILDEQNKLLENMMKPFTKKATNFEQAMREKIGTSPGRQRPYPVSKTDVWNKRVRGIEKVYLIKLIHAKINGKEEQVIRIINQAKYERLQAAYIRKKKSRQIPTALSHAVVNLAAAHTDLLNRCNTALTIQAQNKFLFIVVCSVSESSRGSLTPPLASLLALTTPSLIRYSIVIPTAQKSPPLTMTPKSRKETQVIRPVTLNMSERVLRYRETAKHIQNNESNEEYFASRDNPFENSKISFLTKGPRCAGILVPKKLRRTGIPEFKEQLKSLQPILITRKNELQMVCKDKCAEMEIVLRSVNSKSTLSNVENLNIAKSAYKVKNKMVTVVSSAAQKGPAGSVCVDNSGIISNQSLVNNTHCNIETVLNLSNKEISINENVDCCHNESDKMECNDMNNYPNLQANFEEPSAVPPKVIQFFDSYRS